MTSLDKSFIILKKIKILNSLCKNILFVFLSNKKIILFKTSSNIYKYLQVPVEIQVIIKNSFIFLYTKKENITHLVTFEKVVTNFIKNINKIFSKKLILKGLGMKIFLTTNAENNCLKFKLGFSHLIEYKIPASKLQFLINKNTISIKSENINFVGNFSSKIRNLKRPNIYNGKGLSYKHEKIVLKVFKKK